MFRGLLLTILLLLPVAARAADDPLPVGSQPLLRIAIGQTIQPEQINRMAEVEGHVTFAGTDGHSIYLEVNSAAGFIPVTVTHSAGYLTDLLLRSRIHVRGICTAARSLDGRMVINLSPTNVNDITLLQVPEETWRRYSFLPITGLTKTNVSEDIVHLYGTVQSAQPGNSFTLADETGTRTVASRQATSDMVGLKVEALCGWYLRETNRVLQCALWRELATTNRISLSTLTTAEQILWLTPAEARQAFPVKLRGVVTFIRSDHKGGNIQDGSGGIFLWRLNLARNISNIVAGDFCEVDGVTSSGSFSPQVYPRKVKVLGAGQFPEPIHPTWDELIHGGLDAQWAEVQGVVLSATNHTMGIGMKGGHISCLVQMPRAAVLNNFLGDIVRVRGVILSQHDTRRHIVGVQINVPSTKFVSVEMPPLADPFSIPVTHASDLFIYNPGESDFREVKVAGQVVHSHNDTCEMMDGTNGIRLVLKSDSDVTVGDLVEAVGFPEIDSPFDKPLLTLRGAVVRRTGQSPMPAPIKIPADDLLNRQHDSTWVQVESRLLGVNQYPDEQVLELQTGAHVYDARLNSASGPIPSMQIGSLLKLSGVYALSNDKLVPFELLLNSPRDIQILELPPWWTPMRTLAVVCGMGLFIILVLAWNSVLRRQVNRRTSELSAEMAERRRTESELIEMRSRHLVEQERTRIARDLHDDLGSRVTQLVLLNELTLQNRVAPGGAMEHAREISDAARQMIQSLDETVWAVNPRNDKLPRLLNYLGQFAISFLKHSNVRCRIDFPDDVPDRTVSAEVRHNLFLALKEALNNAIRHAQATEVWLRANITSDSLALTVQDNGSGLKPRLNDSSANGLQNMRQRMEEISGNFKIETAAGQGVKVTLVFPWNGMAHAKAIKNKPGS